MKIKELKERNEKLNKLLVDVAVCDRELNYMIEEYIEDEMQNNKNEIERLENIQMVNKNIKLRTYDEHMLAYGNEVDLFEIEESIKILIFNINDNNNFIEDFINILNKFIKIDNDESSIYSFFDMCNYSKKVFDVIIHDKKYKTYNIKMYLTDEDESPSDIRVIYKDKKFSTITLEQIERGYIENKYNDVVVPVKEEEKKKSFKNKIKDFLQTLDEVTPSFILETFLFICFIIVVLLFIRIVIFRFGI